MSLKKETDRIGGYFPGRNGIPHSILNDLDFIHSFSILISNSKLLEAHGSMERDKNGKNFFLNFQLCENVNDDNDPTDFGYQFAQKDP
jgi:hypothetical protein